MRACARWLRQRLGNARFAPVFSSSLRRASEGARIVAGDGATPIEIADFAEIDFGLFEGLTAGEIRARYPAEFLVWDRHRLAPDYVYPGGESRAAFAARVARGTDRMLAEIAAHDSDSASGEAAYARCALLAAHRGVIRAVVRRLSGIEPFIELGSIQILTHEAGEWRPEVLDLTDHLRRPEESE
jgi:probable phosphoglycerate mutase